MPFAKIFSVKNEDFGKTRESFLYKISFRLRFHENKSHENSRFSNLAKISAHKNFSKSKGKAKNWFTVQCRPMWYNPIRSLLSPMWSYAVTSRSYGVLCGPMWWLEGPMWFYVVIKRSYVVIKMSYVVLCGDWKVLCGSMWWLKGPMWSYVVISRSYVVLCGVY